MQRGIQQADRDWKPIHGPKDPLEIFPLEGKQVGQGGFASRGVAGQNHLPNAQNSLGFEEHVLGPAEPDAFGAEPPGELSVLGCVGIRANPHPGNSLGPAH